MKYDIGCKCADNILAESHQDSMLPASKVTHIESDGQLVTIPSAIRYHSKNGTFKTIRMSSIQTYSVGSENREEIQKPLQYVYDAGICL